MKIRAEILDRIHTVPPLPLVVVRLADLLRDPGVSIHQLVEVVRFDPGITAQVICMANSAYFGSGRKLDSLREALVRLGNNQLFSFILASSVRPMLQSPLAGYQLDHGELWRHSAAVAIAAERIEQRLGGKRAEAAFTAGLLHDLGKLVLSAFIEQSTERIREHSHQNRVSFELAEREVFGIDHMELGALLLEKWGFPPETVSVVRWHHEPASGGEHCYLADLVHIADALVLSLGIGAGVDGLCYHLDAGSFDRLQLDRKLLDLLASQVLEEVEALDQAFKVN